MFGISIFLIAAMIVLNNEIVSAFCGVALAVLAFYFVIEKIWEESESRYEKDW